MLIEVYDANGVLIMKGTMICVHMPSNDLLQYRLKRVYLPARTMDDAVRRTGDCRVCPLE